MKVLRRRVREIIVAMPARSIELGGGRFHRFVGVASGGGAVVIVVIGGAVVFLGNENALIK